jgi:hypothetical protein
MIPRLTQRNKLRQGVRRPHQYCMQKSQVVGTEGELNKESAELRADRSLSGQTLPLL